ncbi:sulfatase-like hydrolase/transferase [Flammeovirga yaeyamensis]|uniref:Sulfatase-like hydrolase/transferase n=2 Tax=Flammeovirga yaeyamensis TaxID=367791 RepID=A0AAX1NEH5_9BACT|nr:arylsulfatase [Flammeovirga yaeyamensis]QWG05556.1 sulfatase-like hydrolase/transferase [Flammeovirga yaeyamensis]
MNYTTSNLLIFFLLLLPTFSFGQKKQAPNVILILTDDQGIGDLGCHGNPWLKTPNIDKFYEQSVRLTDFHVSPLCTPTRAAIMTGQYPIRNGAWATYKGRDALSKGQLTMADVFKSAGYSTALFGKWHLGDNYPVRPSDSGFDNVVQHLAGGIGELSDYWGNSYFDDVYYVNNQPQQFQGYCTDVWFSEAMKFINQQEKEQPFFIYLPLNAPHDPLIVDEKYAAPYKKFEGSEIIDANLYGMIANIDENFGKFRKFLRKKGLDKNTILIYMSDNGTRFGYSRDGKLGYNYHLKGMKGDKFEGGHRVPFFIQWMDGGIEGGKDISSLSAHVDLIPTLAHLCGIPLPKNQVFDGIDLSGVLTKNEEAKDRSVFVHHRQDWRPPLQEKGTCVLKNEWRLINGHQLYNMKSDPQQTTNVADENKELVEALLEENKSFYQQTKTYPTFYELPSSVIGATPQKEVKLTIQHAIGEDKGIWKCEQVADGMKNKNNTHALEIQTDGEYLISCRRWPKECAGPMHGIPSKNPKDLFDYKTIQPEKVRIKIGNQMLEKEVNPEVDEVVFKVTLEKGKTLLVNDFVEGDEVYGVYYTYITFISEI